MELDKAKEIVRSLAGTRIYDKSKYSSIDIAEGIRMVCDNSLNDPESREVQNCIPQEMSFMGLYPHIMKPLIFTTK